MTTDEQPIAKRRRMTKERKARWLERSYDTNNAAQSYDSEKSKYHKGEVENPECKEIQCLVAVLIPLGVSVLNLAEHSVHPNAP
ncbi:hypothetical protein AVEN_180380-1 [Araneus ventricosus]|uniref:Uncharacterized protein n=1 Tax=Araneus ventricosus TaxID=182803 RepID=A0A4Y2GSC7_ARAVE|nr:hypothetical protein AVEN_72155-1 [Araneus ventricosus]GBM55631.1 hypothetical protein AVEN_114815-1 [Araneus ventricosus]GBM55646.1 hypothetical protein AVEN_201966-1 [Araneus ventricosus]GBM56238.1 hypothetical protein AVEN_180380-1 [Araneus ventricosus]